MYHFPVADLRLPALTARGRAPAPGALHGFPPAIHLPLKHVLMEPFTSVAEREAAAQAQPILLMLKTAQKYFVHERSVVPPPPPPQVAVVGEGA